MPHWLVEDLGFIALLLGVAGGVLFYFWWRDRKRKEPLLAAGVLALLALVAAVIWYIGGSDEKQIQHALAEMSEGVKARNLERSFAHISASFRYGSHDKQAFRARSEEAVRRGDVTEVSIWGFKVNELSRKQRCAAVEFAVKPKGKWGTEISHFLCRAEFVLDPDDKWRLKSFTIHNPVSDIHTPLQIPGF